MSLKYILGLPDEIEGVGTVYPIRIKDYEEFAENSNFLQISKHAFIEEVQDVPLMDLLVFGLKNQEIIRSMEVVLSLSLREEVKYHLNEKYHGFLIPSKNTAINSDNYDAVRESIMKHDLIFEPKIYKSKIVQEWADKVMKAKSKGAKTTMEEMISVVQAYTGVSYEDIGEYTIYQLYTSFNRIAKIIIYETTVKFRAAGGEVVIEDYSGKIDLHKSPYDDLFVAKDKLSGINQALK